MNDPALIEWLSPSALTRLQACGLAESRRRSGGGGGSAAPSNPVARLGNAAHRTLEWVANQAPEIDGDPNSEDLIATRWAEEVAAESAEAERYPQERAFGPPERWPSYGRIAASVRVDGRELATELADLPPERRSAERALATGDGFIRGTADLILLDTEGAATIIDHKSGTPSEEDMAVGGRYEQQVLLYVVMARSAGLRPTRAEIRPLGHAPVQVNLPEARLAEVVDEARSQVKRYNTAVQAGRSVDLATPSESSCGWCPYALDCPAVWSIPRPDLGDFHLVEGETLAAQVLTNSIAIKLRTGDDDFVVAGIPRTDDLADHLVPGIRVKLSGLEQGAPGVFRFRSGRTQFAVVSSRSGP